MQTTIEPRVRGNEVGQSPDTMHNGLNILHLTDICIRSLNWLSHDPEGRGEREVREYNAYFLKDLDYIDSIANGHDVTEIKQRYHKKYSELLSAYYHSRSNTASTFITGGSNFPVRRQEKLHKWADNKLTFLYEWSKRFLKAVEKSLKTPKTIDSELARYQKELAERIKTQEYYKLCNKIVKSKLPDVEKVAQLMQKANLSESEALKVLKPDYCNRPGFARFYLTNNLAAIKRVEGMIERFNKRAVATETGEGNKDYTFRGVRVVHNVGEDRLQLFFEGKPEYEIRAMLKKNAFRWSPSNNCWQSYLTQWQADRAKRVIEAFNPVAQ